MSKKQTFGRLGAEFAIIVIGVLVALAFDQAAEASDERDLEQAYLLRLAQDIRVDSIRTEGQIFRWQSLRTGAEAILPYLEDRTILLHDPVGFAVEAVQAATQNWNPVEAGTFEELQSTGGLSLIRNDDLRASLLNYHRSAQRRKERVDRMELSFRLLVQRFGGLEIWEAGMECYGLRNELRDFEPFDCHKDIPAPALDRFVFEMRNDPIVVKALRQRLIDIWTLNNWFDTRLMLQAELLHQIDEEIEE